MEKLRWVRFLILIVFSFGTFVSQAEVSECTSELKQFPLECQMQLDWYHLKNQFQNKFKIDINEIAEYKALRFIDRWSWQGAKAKVPPKNISEIYEPRGTWEMWNAGIDQIMNQYQFLHLYLISDEAFVDMITQINHGLIAQKNMKRSIRNYRSTQVGFCDVLNTDKVSRLEKSRESFEIYQKEWELRAQKSVFQFMKAEGAESPADAFLGGEVYQRQELGPSCSQFNERGQRQMWIEFTQSYKVQKQLSWLRVFLKWNLQKIMQKSPQAISPIELGAVVQKWFVSIHPFEDGNGRTSRALQDLIHQYFGLPFVSSGDLQDDIYAPIFDYIDLNRLMTEKQLKKMQGCLNQMSSQVWRNNYEKYACQILQNGKML